MSWPAIRWADAQTVYSASERAVLATLAHRARKKDALAWPSLATLAEKCGVCEKTVYSTIRALADRGLLTIEGHRRRRKYRLRLEAGNQIDGKAREGEDDEAGKDFPETGNDCRLAGNGYQRSYKDPNPNLRRRRGAAADAAAAAGSAEQATNGAGGSAGAADAAGAAGAAMSGSAGAAMGGSAGAAMGGENWPARLKAYREAGHWYAGWGPKPGEPGCRAPGEVAAR